MIHQISPVPTKTVSLTKINKALIEARHIQAHVKERVATGPLPNRGELWSPITGGPFMVPVSRWIE